MMDMMRKWKRMDEETGKDAVRNGNEMNEDSHTNDGGRKMMKKMIDNDEEDDEMKDGMELDHEKVSISIPAIKPITLNWDFLTKNDSGGGRGGKAKAITKRVVKKAGRRGLISNLERVPGTMMITDFFNTGLSSVRSVGEGVLKDSRLHSRVEESESGSRSSTT